MRQRFRMAQVGIVIDGWAADIHVDTAFVDGLEFLFFSPQDVINPQSHRGGYPFYTYILR